MFIENNKMFFIGSKKVLETELHTDIRKIVADILEIVFKEEIKDYELEIDFSSVLFLSTNVSEFGILEIGEDFFEEFKDLPNITFPIKINIAPPTEVFNKDRMYLVSTLIVGFLNNIHPSIYDKVMQYTSMSAYIFGDIQVESNEYNNYHIKILSNALYTHKIEPDMFRLVDKKKINTTLSKLRKDSVINLAELSNSSIVSVSYDNNIDTGYITNYLETHENSLCVVPRNVIPRVNSILWSQIHGNVKIDLKPNMEFYLKYPYTHITNSNQYVYIPALSIVRIIFEPEQNIITLENGHRIVSVRVHFEFNNKKYIPDTNVLIDLDDLILSFDPTLQAENYYDYIRLLDFADDLQERYQSDPNRIADLEISDHYIAYLTPFLIVAPEVAKYKPFNHILSYLELEERDITFSYDSYYKQLSQVLDSMEIHYSETYTESNVF